MNIPSLIKKLIARQDLTEDESFAAITAMLSGTFTEGQIGAYLATLSAKGETIAEIARARNDDEFEGVAGMRIAEDRIVRWHPAHGAPPLDCRGCIVACRRN